MRSHDQSSLQSPFNATSTARNVLEGVDLTGRTAVITGGYSGLGLEYTRNLAAIGADTVVLARRPEAAAIALRDVDRCTIIPADLANLASVRHAADRIKRSTNSIEIVMANAGIMASAEHRIGPGWENHLASNHFGHFVLVTELFGCLTAGEGARVVVTSSAAHALTDIRWHDPHFLIGYDKWLAYGQSKTANALFAVHLNTLGQPHGIHSFSLHPGKIMTALQRDLSLTEQVENGWIDRRGTVIDPDFKSLTQGAATGLWAATAPLLSAGGSYLEDCNVAHLASAGASVDDGGVHPYAIDPESAARLWETTLATTAATPLPS